MSDPRIDKSGPVPPRPLPGKPATPKLEAHGHHSHAALPADSRHLSGDARPSHAESEAPTGHHSLSSATSAAGGVAQINAGLFAAGDVIRNGMGALQGVASAPASVLDATGKIRPLVQKTAARAAAAAAVREGASARVLTKVQAAGEALDRHAGWLERAAKAAQGDAESLAHMASSRLGPLFSRLTALPGVSAAGRFGARLINWIGRAAPLISAGFAVWDIGKATRQPTDLNRGNAVMSTAGAVALGVGLGAAAIGAAPLEVAAGAVGIGLGALSFLDTTFNHGRVTQWLGHQVDRALQTGPGRKVGNGVYNTLSHTPLIGRFFQHQANAPAGT